MIVHEYHFFFAWSKAWSPLPPPHQPIDIVKEDVFNILQGDDDAWEDVGDEEEDMSAQQSSLLGSPFAPASEYAGEPERSTSLPVVSVRRHGLSLRKPG